MKDNRNREWTMQEDNAIKHFMNLGYTAKKIYDNYGDMFGRTEKAISCRMGYLKKPIEERMKINVKESESENKDVLKKLEEQNIRLCNRLDILTNQFEKLLNYLQNETERQEKNCDTYVKALYEIKTSVFDSASEMKTIKSEVKKITHKMRA